MSDANDEATEIEIAERHIAIQAAIAENKAQSHPDFDGKSCLQCGDEIPLARLEMGKIRCVYCQSAFETKRRYYK